jgi:hypothetical protein
LASFVDPSPSVVDEPNATIAASRDEPATSTPVRKGHDVIVFATGNFTVPVESPVSGETKLVCSARMCEVVATVVSGKKRLIARSDNAPTSSPTGSLIAVDPAGTEVDEPP